MEAGVASPVRGSQFNSGCGKGWVSEAAGGGERGDDEVALL
jgi:hypothetical protein